MKQKVLYLILGIVIGVVLTTGVFMMKGGNKGPGGNGQRPDFENFDPENMPEDFKNRGNGNFKDIKQNSENTETSNTDSES